MELRNQVDAAIASYPKAVWKGEKGADQRIFGIELCGGAFKSFYSDHNFRNIGENYLNCKISNLQTLAGRIDAIEGNMGSGEGWHRDANYLQYKVIVYLSDVNVENGPFQLISKSHKLGQKLKDSLKMDLDDYSKTRFMDEQVKRITEASPERLITLNAPAGTVMLFDATIIHRGCPIRTGRRYALTNYYYPYYDIVGRLENFLPRLTSKIIKAA